MWRILRQSLHIVVYDKHLATPNLNSAPKEEVKITPQRHHQTHKSRHLGDTKPAFLPAQLDHYRPAIYRQSAEKGEQPTTPPSAGSSFKQKA